VVIGEQFSFEIVTNFVIQGKLEKQILEFSISVELIDLYHIYDLRSMQLTLYETKSTFESILRARPKLVRVDNAHNKVWLQSSQLGVDVACWIAKTWVKLFVMLRRKCKFYHR
jgi:hypothetical protein